MRIALFTFSFPVLSETFIVKHFLGLLNKGWDVHVVCFSSDPEAWAHYQNLKADKRLKGRIHCIPISKNRSLMILPWLLFFFQAALKCPSRLLHYFQRGFSYYGFLIIKKFYEDAALLMLKPDLIHFEFGTLAVGKMHLGSMLKAKTVVSFRGYDISHAGLEQPDFYQKVWQNADAFHFLGQDLKFLAQKRGYSSLKKTILIPPAIQTEINPGEKEIPNEMGTAKRPLRIISVGRLHWKKGYEYALKAIYLLMQQNIVLEYRIVGAGDYFEALSFCRHQFGLENCVEFVGEKSNREVLEQLQWADLFLHAAVSEGFSNAVMEAQSMKLPVVTSDAAGLAANVQHEVTGMVVRRRDPEALANAIAELIKTPKKLHDMGEKGRERVLQHFRLEDQIKKFEMFYREILSSR